MTLIQKTTQWGIDKGLTGPNGKATVEGQFWKFIEELHELRTAMRENNHKEIRDALGDLQVVAVQAYTLKSDVIASPADCGTAMFSYIDNVEILASCALSEIMREPEDSFSAVREIARRLGHCPDECLQEAYDIISKRTGKMENGTFIKD